MSKFSVVGRGRRALSSVIAGALVAGVGVATVVATAPQAAAQPWMQESETAASPNFDAYLSASTPTNYSFPSTPNKIVFDSSGNATVDTTLGRFTTNSTGTSAFTKTQAWGAYGKVQPSYDAANNRYIGAGGFQFVRQNLMTNTWYDQSYLGWTTVGSTTLDADNSLWSVYWTGSGSAPASSSGIAGLQVGGAGRYYMSYNSPGNAGSILAYSTLPVGAPASGSYGYQLSTIVTSLASSASQTGKLFYDSTSGYLYWPNGSNVTVVRTSDNTVMNTLTLPGTSTGDGWLDGQSLWLTTTDGVTQINTATRAISQNVSLSFDPNFVSVSSDGMVYALLQGTTSAAEITASTGALTSGFAVTPSTTGLWRNHITNRIWSTVSTDDKIHILREALPPAWTTNPASQSVASGTAVTFTAVDDANAWPAPTYQWQYSDGGGSWSNVSAGSLSAGSVTSKSITLAGGGINALIEGRQYRVVATNASAAVASSAATLSVSQAPVVTLQACNATTDSDCQRFIGGVGTVYSEGSFDANFQVGTSVTLTTAGYGMPRPTVQWQKSTNGGSSWSNVSGTDTPSGNSQVSSSYTFTMAAGDDNAKFRAVYSNSNGSTTTDSTGVTYVTTGNSTAASATSVVTVHVISAPVVSPTTYYVTNVAKYRWPMRTVANLAATGGGTMTWTASASQAGASNANQSGGNGTYPALTLSGGSILGYFDSASGSEYTMYVDVANAVGTTTRTLVTVRVPYTPVLPVAARPDATVGTAYSSSAAVTSGEGSITYAVTSGSLPAGLTLNSSSGLISGTPTDTGSQTTTSTFTITATGVTVLNAETGVSAPSTDARSYTIATNAAPSTTSLNPTGIAAGAGSTVTITGQYLTGATSVVLTPTSGSATTVAANSLTINGLGTTLSFVDPGLTGSTYTVQVNTAYGSASNLSLLVQDPPDITSVTRTWIVPFSGEARTLESSYAAYSGFGPHGSYTGATSVTVSYVDAQGSTVTLPATFTVVDDDHILFTPPDVRAGVASGAIALTPDPWGDPDYLPATVTVTAASGLTATANIKYTTVTQVSGVSPNAGPAYRPAAGWATGGDTVTLTGTFPSCPNVRWGVLDSQGNWDWSFNAVNLQFLSPSGCYWTPAATSIEIERPGSTDLTWDGQVDSNDAVVQSTTHGYFRIEDQSGYTAYAPYTVYAQPVVTAVATQSGAAAASTNGDTLVITGTELDDATTITVGGVAATIVSNTPTQVVITVPAGVAAGNATVVFTNPGGSDSGSTQLFANGPVITSVTPASVPTAGGTTVTLVGTGLANVTLKVDGQATAIVSQSATSLTFSTPAHAVGSVTIRVTDPVTTLYDEDSVTYALAPTITSITPSTVSTGGGSLITIVGTNLTGATLTVNGVSVTPTVNLAGTSLTFTAPANSAGSVTVAVTTGVGTVSTSLTYAVGPAVTSVVPGTISTAGGTTVVITGTGFTGATAVDFDSTAATSFTVDSATQITAVAPAHAAGVVAVTVTGASGLTAAGSATYAAPPTITSITPTGVSTAGGASVTIAGTGFSLVTSVTVGGQSVAAVANLAGTSLTFTSPALGAGSQAVVVTSVATGLPVSTSLTYAAPATLGSPSPAYVSIGSATTVTITGTGLTGATVTVAGQSVAPTINGGGTSMSFTVPAGQSVGSVPIVVTNSAGVTTSTSVTAAAPPTVTTGVNSGGLAYASTSGGTVLTLTGTGLNGATVSLGGTPLTVTAGPAGTLLVTVPAGAAGGATLTVTAATTGLTTTFPFTYAVPPTITSVTPASSGPQAGGGAVRLVGTDLANATVTLADANSTTAQTVTSDTVGGTWVEITAIPAGTPGAVTLEATSASTGLTASTTYTYLAAPTITSITLPVGLTAVSTAGGQSITIAGTNFTQGTTVTIGGVSATVASVNLAGTSATVTVPAGVATGSAVVSLSTAGGSATSSVTVAVAPVITSLTPSSVSTAGGTTVAVAGSGFLSSMVFTVGGTTTTKANVSATAFDFTTAAHAAGAVTALITDPATGLSSSATLTFVGPATITSILNAAGLAYASTSAATTMTITGTGFTGSTVTVGGQSVTPTINGGGTSMTISVPSGLAAGPASVVVTNAAGIPSTASITIAAPPSVTTVTYANGTSGASSSGGSIVNLAGTGLAGASAAIGATSLTTTAGAAGSLNVTIPATAVGNATVTVTSATTGLTATATVAVVAPPTITSLTPASSGPVAGGNTVRINGTDLGSATVALDDGVNSPVSITVSASDTTNGTWVDVTMPAGSAGQVTLIVTSATTGLTASTPYTYVPAPTITSITLPSGLSAVSTAGGQSITIAGSNFVAGTTVTIGGSAATITSQASGSLVVTVPSGLPAGPASVVVTSPGGTATSSVTVAAPPTITSLTPSAVSTTGGTSVTVTGTGLAGITSITVGGQSVAATANIAGTSVTFTAPALSAGSQAIVVTSSTTGLTASSSLTYAAPATVTAVSPSTVSTSSATAVTISGTGFTGATVTVGGSSVAPIINLAGTSMTIQVPSGLSAGSVPIVITNVVGVTTSTSVTAAVPPTITSLSPASGIPAGGSTVTINGSNFAQNATVTVAGATVAASVNQAGTAITFTAPAGAAGAASVVVSNPSTGLSSSSTYTYVGPPTIIGAPSPSTGSTAGGTTITVYGTNLASATVTIAGQSVTPAVSGSGTSLTFTLPAGLSVGSAAIVVTTPSGTAQGSLTIVAAPTVTSVAQAQGAPTASTAGDDLVITGTDLANATNVDVGGVTAIINTNTATSIEVTVLSGVAAGTATVTVTTAGGQASGSMPFATPAVPAPTISTTSPTSVLLAGGTVAITGTNLTGATVTVGGTPATNVSVTGGGTILTFTAPAQAAGAQTVVVTTGSGSANTSLTYVSLPSALTVSPASTPDTGGATLTLTASGFWNAGLSVVSAVVIGTTTLNPSDYTVDSDTQITVTAAPAGTAGPVSVSVDTTVASVTSTVYGALVYTPAPPVAPAPTLTTCVPAVGTPSGGTVVTITGTNLWNATVTVGGAPATNVTVNPLGTQVMFRTPAGTPGASAQIVVTASGGTVQAPFAYLGTPVVTAVAAATGTVGRSASTAGDDLVITGTDLDNATDVFVGGVRATITANTSTSISVTVPAGVASGLATVSVVTAIGTGTGSMQFDDPPTITSLSPSTVSTAGGTVVTVVGLNFANAATVTVNGVAVTPVIVAAGGTTVTFAAPAQGQAGSYAVVVTNPASGLTSTTQLTFTAPVAPAPPASGGGSTSGGASNTVPVTLPAPTASTVTTAPVTLPSAPAPVALVTGPLPAPPVGGVAFVNANGQPIAGVVVTTPDNRRVVAQMGDSSVQVSAVTGSGNALRLGRDGEVVVQGARNMEVQVSGFAPNTDVHVWIYPEDGRVNVQARVRPADGSPTAIYLGVLHTNAAGDATGSLSAPAELQAGKHVLQVNGRTADGIDGSYSFGVRVEGQVTEPVAARTTKSRMVAIYFDPLSARLSTSSKDRLDRLAAGIGSAAKSTVAIGYVQPTGTTSNDAALSRARATAVADYLKRAGLVGRITVTSGGAAGGEGALGRRVDVQVTYTRAARR